MGGGPHWVCCESVDTDDGGRRGEIEGVLGSADLLEIDHEDQGVVGRDARPL